MFQITSYTVLPFVVNDHLSQVNNYGKPFATFTIISDVSLKVDLKPVKTRTHHSNTKHYKHGFLASKRVLHCTVKGNL